MKDIVLILILQLFYVPMLALRTISMVKKLTLLTAFFGFLESLIYVFGLAIVFSGEQSIYEMLIYAVGFSLGLIVGIYIEKRIAIGHTSIQVNMRNNNVEMINHLREQGFGVTVFQGEGKDSIRYRLEVLTKRSREIELMGIIDTFEPTAFVVSYEPTRLKGGYLEVLMSKQNKILAKGTRISKTEKQTAVKPVTWFRKTVDEFTHEISELVVHDINDKDL
jgi:uncharacterized protein YebE (UPF0316 family)